MIQQKLIQALYSFSYTLKLTSFLYFDSIVFYVISLYLLTQWVSPVFSAFCITSVFLLFLARESLYAPVFVSTLFYAFLFLEPNTAEHFALAAIVMFAQFRFFLRKAKDDVAKQERLQFLERAIRDN